MKNTVIKSLFFANLFLFSAYAGVHAVAAELSHKELRKIKKVDCQVDHGNITIKASKKADYSDVYCRYTPHNTQPKETVKVYIDDKELKIRFDKDALKKKKKKGKMNVVPHSDARVDFELCVPPHVETKIYGGKNDIAISGLSKKDITLKVGTGKVALDNIKSDVDIEMGNVQDLYVGYSKNISEKDMFDCSLRIGNLMQGVVRIPAEYCVKNELRAAPYATRVSNDFAKCPKKPNVIIEGSIGSGSLKIAKQ